MQSIQVFSSLALNEITHILNIQRVYVILTTSRLRTVDTNIFL